MYSSLKECEKTVPPTLLRITEVEKRGEVENLIIFC